MVTRYVNGPVKQEGICLFPPPPAAHYRMIQSQRAEGFPVSTPPGSYVPNQGNQGGNQGPGLRAIAPTVPPNQASTPPNADIKVQTLSQAASMNPPMYVTQAVRTTQPFYPPRTAPPPNQNPRMPNNHNRPPQQTLYQQQFVQMQQPIYIPTGYYGTGNRPPQNYVPQAIPVYTGPTLTTFPYPTSQPQAPSVSYNYFPPSTIIPQRSLNPTPQPSTSNPTQTAMPVPIVPNNLQHQPFQRQPHKRRPKALCVIDPETGADRLSEMFEESSHPPSGESSARQTPQPAYNPNKEVQATFAKQVMQAISNDLENQARLEAEAAEQHHHPHLPHQHLQDPSGDHIEQNAYPQPPQPAVQTNLEHLVQSSSFNAMAKEFVLPSSTAKETPIVSANCDAVEVTLPNKLPKDSPGKGRKREQQHAPKEHKEVAKEQPIVNKEISIEKQPILSKESDSKKDIISSTSNATNTPQVPVLSKDSSKDEKKTQRKDSKPEIKVPIVEPSIESLTITPTPTLTQSPSSQDINSNPKSKQNVRSAAKQASQSSNNASKQNQAPVPQPQPPKASNKTQKKNELNQKGANKEGTDMDAFNDNVIAKEEINSNIPVNITSNSTNDIINANSTSITNNAAPITITRDININNEINSKKSESNEMTIKMEPMKPLKSKIDVTDIVRDKPKQIKPFNSTMEAQDEPDRAIPNDKVVQTKNEANSKISNESRTESKLPYREGQWTPDNTTGSRQYEKDFLIALRDSPCSRMKPENIPDMILADDRGRLSDGRSSMSGRTDFTNPPFNNYGGKSGSRGMLAAKRNSQSKMGPGNQKPKAPIKVSISVKEDVKLHETENAWRPARFNVGEFQTDDDRKTIELYRKVRGVLNKLTPEKFSTLLSQIKSLQIDTPNRLQGVIDLVFEKAVDEPNFSVAYANMCKELALMQVPTGLTLEDNKPEYVNFRKLLVTRCQVEFEKQSVDESIRNTKLKEIEECSDPDKKKDLQFDLDEYDRKLRMKSVGNIRFIGELFKQSMLTVNIMMRCLNNLIENRDEESLECLCKLLSTIGKEIEQKVNLQPIFTQMKNLADKKDNSGKISNRIRFMLQDVIDLKSSKWIPRRQDVNPRTIEQIQKEADNEQMNQMMNSVQITPRKDDRMGGLGVNVDRKGRSSRNVSDNEGWITNNSNRNRTPFSVQSEKLKAKAPMIDEPLGNSAMFGLWGKGAMGTKAPTQPMGNTNNIYSTLENMDPEKRNLGSRPKDPYNSKGPSMERVYNKYDGRGSRSGSQHRSNDSSASSSQRSTPAPMVPPQVAKVAQVAPAIPQMSEDQMDRRIGNSLDEYISGNCSTDEYYQEISGCIPVDYHSRMIANSYLRVLEKSQQARLKTGELFAKLIKQGRIQLSDYCQGLEEILSQADDLKIDIPKFWDYLADILVDLICEESLPLQVLQKSLTDLLSPRDCSRILAPLFKLVINRKGPVFLRNIWLKSGLQLSQFIEESQVESFIQENQLDFLLGGVTTFCESNLSYEEIESQLRELIKATNEFDVIISWITANVGDRVQENRFIRTLATVIFEDSVSRKNAKAITDRLTHHNNLLLKYVDNNPTYELQCLYALQALIQRMEHPQGLLLLICNKLYELGTFSQESFIAWEQSTDAAEQEGKGVALKQLTSFFTQLKENDEDDDGDAEDDADADASASEGDA